MALRLCKKCRKKILSKAIQCPYCGCPVEQYDEELICKINNIDYDFTDIYQELMNVKMENKEWKGSDELRKIVYEIYDLTNLANPAILCFKIVESGSIPSEYNAMTAEEWKKQAKKSTQSRIVVKCPYCGSINVKKIFFGGFAQKQWHCNNCRSDF